MKSFETSLNALELLRKRLRRLELKRCSLIPIETSWNASNPLRTRSIIKHPMISPPQNSLNLYLSPLKPPGISRNALKYFQSSHKPPEINYNALKPVRKFPETSVNFSDTLLQLIYKFVRQLLQTHCLALCTFFFVRVSSGTLLPNSANNIFRRKIDVIFSILSRFF